MKRQKKCIQCGYQWEPRAKAPKQCPRCKRYDWKPALAAFVREGEPNRPLESNPSTPTIDPTETPQPKGESSHETGHVKL